MYNDDNFGAMYAFDWNGSSFEETQKIRATSFEEFSAFGDTIAALLRHCGLH